MMGEGHCFLIIHLKKTAPALYVLAALTLKNIKQKKNRKKE